MKKVRNLTATEIKELEKLYKYSPNTRVRERCKVILLSNNDKSIKELIDIFGLDRGTISTLINKFNEQGIRGLYDLPRSGRPCSLTMEEKEFVLKLVAIDSRNLNFILGELEANFGKIICKETLIRFIKKKKYIWKRMRKSLKNKRNEAEFQLFKLLLTEMFEKEDAGIVDVYAYDEASINLVPSVPYGWIKINKDVELPSSKSQNLSILGFINRDNDLHSYLVKGSVNSDVVIGCFDDFAENKFEKPRIVLIDNAPTHTSAKFEEKKEEWKKKNLYVVNIPKYSPEHNMIEILWRFIKYKWIDLKAYESFEKLEIEVMRILKNVGSEYRIDFKKEANKK